MTARGLLGVSHAQKVRGTDASTTLQDHRRGRTKMRSIRAVNASSATMIAAAALMFGVVASMLTACEEPDGAAVAISSGALPPGYRDWKLISVAHEKGDLNDLRAILGNDVAIKAYREGKTRVPGRRHHRAARLALRRVGGERRRPSAVKQSFVAGPPENGLQFMVKDPAGTLRPEAGGTSLRRRQARGRGGACELLRRATKPPRIGTSCSPSTRLDPTRHNQEDRP